ncbi:aflatoxin B1 aldehyde reductase member 2 [Ascobolus immersus RN42]|uniref:Aflatoxin B1 aldehyde reductase member 2 n=1 Tax=Ascobolus immersus RN42 TaxID=1160509 RepID=A0A3N4IA97_ASCIM|nr:aflatoxin B1 aldehyde reductase member 2 [Ascobolus immersus RN42]
MPEQKNRVILGMMTFGPPEVGSARITSIDETKKIFQHLKDEGYDEIDTARVYCEKKQEAFTREAGYKDYGFKVATKLYPNTPGTHKRDVIIQNVNDSLEALGTDCVDIWYLHAPDRSVPFTETLEAVNDLYKQGKFKQLAISNYTAFEVAELSILARERGWVRPTLYQAMYNAITRGIEKELVVACRKYGLDIVVYNPLAGGFFSGKYKTSDVPESGRFSNREVAQGSNYRNRYFKDGYFEAISKLEPVVKKHNLTLIETALRWVTHHSALKTRAKGGNDGVIIGVSSYDQLVNNLKDLEKGPLPEEVVQALDEAWKIVQPDAPNYWHLELKYDYTV